MDRKTVVAEVGSWPIGDRLRLMEEIWEGILDQGSESALTEAQKAELALRLAEDDATPDDVVSWEEVKTAALRRAGR